jgi:hypothetical protein
VVAGHPDEARPAWREHREHALEHADGVADVACEDEAVVRVWWQRGERLEVRAVIDVEIRQREEARMPMVRVAHARTVSDPALSGGLARRRRRPGG